MKIDEEKCTGCGICIDYCNVDAISLFDEVAQIDSDVCVECWVCYRNQVCPFDCFVSTPLETYGDLFKHVLSDPSITSKGTGIPGRGTEEAKTNDVTGRFAKDTYGICIDMGRPGMGVFLRDAEKVAMAAAQAGFELAPPEDTPLAAIMTDLKTGKLVDECLDYRLLSVIIEGKCKEEKLKGVLKALQRVSNEIDTVFSLGLISRVDDSGHCNSLAHLDELGIPQPHRGKVNVGLGKPLAEV